MIYFLENFVGWFFIILFFSVAVTAIVKTVNEKYEDDKTSKNIVYAILISAVALICFVIQDGYIGNRDQTEYVYVKENGKFYHNGTCGMSKDKNKMDKVSKGFAMLEEYEKCTYCDW
jgi:hypothetical protein